MFGEEMGINTWWQDSVRTAVQEIKNRDSGLRYEASLSDDNVHKRNLPTKVRWRTAGLSRVQDGRKRMAKGSVGGSGGDKKGACA